MVAIILVHPRSLQLISKNSVYIPETFEKNKNSDDNNKYIIE